LIRSRSIQMGGWNTRNMQRRQIPSTQYSSTVRPVMPVSHFLGSPASTTEYCTGIQDANFQPAGTISIDGFAPWVGVGCGGPAIPDLQGRHKDSNSHQTIGLGSEDDADESTTIIVMPSLWLHYSRFPPLAWHACLGSLFEEDAGLLR
jgi:hypothetical protein